MKAVWARLNGRGGASGDGMAMRTEAVGTFEGWRGGDKATTAGDVAPGDAGAQSEFGDMPVLKEKTNSRRV